MLSAPLLLVSAPNHLITYAISKGTEEGDRGTHLITHNPMRMIPINPRRIAENLQRLSRPVLHHMIHTNLPIMPANLAHIRQPIIMAPIPKLIALEMFLELNANLDICM